MVIVEGPDLVGKTTLCRRLVASLNEAGFPHVYRHLGRPPECWRRDPCSMYALLAAWPTVQDRFHLSEVVYAPLIPGRTPHLTPAQYRRVDADCRAKCSWTVVVTAEPSLIERRYRAAVAAGREEMYPLDKVLEANERFATAARDGQLDRYRVTVDAWVRCDEAERWPVYPLLAYWKRLAAWSGWPRPPVPAREGEVAR